jgi:threonine/homoserine/homoserine lactone efflux protein
MATRFHTSVIFLLLYTALLIAGTTIIIVARIPELLLLVTLPAVAFLLYFVNQYWREKAAHKQHKKH